MDFPARVAAFLTFVLILSLSAPSMEARIKFDKIKQDKVDLKKLEFTKDQFFTFLTGEISKRPKGLGTYGEVSVPLCNIKVRGTTLGTLKTLKGRQIKYISNPSCDQTVLQKVLLKSYDYSPDGLSRYGNRRCIMNAVNLIRPILEYYTLLYEVRNSENCPECDERERGKLSKVSDLQGKLEENCGQEFQKIVRFMEDLDISVESAYRKKK